MKKITAIIACVPMTTQHPIMTHNCVKSFRDVVDKIILIQNGDTGIPLMKETIDLADTYVLNKVNRLHAGAINQGFELLQKGEFGMVICDDVVNDTLTYESIHELAEKNSILSPLIFDRHQGGILTREYGAHSMVFVLSKELFWKVGAWKLSGHASDMEWFTRAKNFGLDMSTIENVGQVIHTHPTSTIGLIPNPPLFNENEV